MGQTDSRETEMKKIVATPILLATLAFAAGASPLYITGADGPLNFSAAFDVVDGNLQITLTNTGQKSPTDESGVIGALFFDITGNPTLTPVTMSASGIVNGSGDPAPNWRYDSGISGPDGASQGISAAGYSIFGSKGNFCTGADCGNNLGGIDWGVVNASYSAGSGNGSISDRTLIQDTATFVLSGLPDGFDPSTAISNVSAQYTASLTGTTSTNVLGFDPPPPGVPEPSTYVMLGGGLILLAGVRRRQPRSSR
jgi:PEP-CTERM motif